MEGGNLEGGGKQFFAAGGVQRGPAEERGVLKGLAPADLGVEGGQADAGGEVIQIGGEHGATLDLVEEDPGRFAGGEMFLDDGDRVLGGPQIRGRRRADEDGAIGLGERGVQQRRVQARRCIDNNETVRAAVGGEFEFAGLAQPAAGGALRIAVDQSRLVAGFLERGAEQDGERGLARAAFTVAEGDFHERETTGGGAESEQSLRHKKTPGGDPGVSGSGIRPTRRRPRPP